MTLADRLLVASLSISLTVLGWLRYQLRRRFGSRR